jgi:hypothetical protein
VLKTLNSKRISNSSRCDCRLHSSRAACWAVKDLVGVSQEGSDPTSPKTGFALSEISARIILSQSLLPQRPMIWCKSLKLLLQNSKKLELLKGVMNNSLLFLSCLLKAQACTG